MIRSIEVNSVPNFLNTALSNASNTSNLICYRGHANKSWKIVPNVYRGIFKPETEENSLSELTTEAPHDFEGDNSTFDKLVRAQHYELPTRLLDVTMNPLVGLYFACSDKSNLKDDGNVISIEITSNKRILNHDSDKISLISNLSKLSYSERELTKNYLNKKRKDNTFRILRTEEFINIFNKRAEVKRLVQFIRIEKPYFLNKIIPSDLLRYYFVWPKKTNARIIAQSGAFLAAGLLEFKGFNSSESFKVKKYIVKKDDKAKILNELNSLNINSRTMFPEIEKVSNYIREKYLIK